MQVTAHLKAPTGGHDSSAHSAHFKAVGSTLFDADGNSVAVQQAGVWHGARAIYAWIDFPSPVVVRFQNEAVGHDETFGPVPLLRIIDGSMFAIDGEPQLIAEYDSTQDVWHVVNRRSVGMRQFTIEPA